MWCNKTHTLTFTLAVKQALSERWCELTILGIVRHILHNDRLFWWFLPSLTIDWQYQFVEVSLPDYVPRALAKFKHPPPQLPHNAPHVWTTPIYGQNQYPTTDSSQLWDKNATTQVQAISGIFLNYARAVDLTILPYLNYLLSTSKNPPNIQQMQENNWWTHPAIIHAKYI